MPVNPRTPVLVGYGQLNHREDPSSDGNTKEPVDLMAEAARLAAGPRLLEAVDAISIVNLLSARYRDAGLLLGQRIGADRPATRYSGIGGNVPQSLVNRACLDIQQGRADVVLSDMAANTTGHRKTDQLRIIGLVENAAAFAADVLNPGGTFVAKVFQSGADADLLAQLKRDFATVKHVKPASSRQDSSERYVLATGFHRKP